MYTHLEQWAANTAAPKEQLGVRCLAQGSHLSHGQFQPEPRFEPTTSGYKSDALSIRPRLPHFIRYMGWTPFSLQNCLNSPWHRFNKVLETFLRDFFVHIDMIASNSCCRFVGCTSQRCSIGLRSGDCGGHLRKVNSLSCSRNQSEMI